MAEDLGGGGPGAGLTEPEESGEVDAFAAAVRAADEAMTRLRTSWYTLMQLDERRDGAIEVVARVGMHEVPLPAYPGLEAQLRESQARRVLDAWDDLAGAVQDGIALCDMIRQQEAVDAGAGD